MSGYHRTYVRLKLGFRMTFHQCYPIGINVKTTTRYSTGSALTIRKGASMVAGLVQYQPGKCRKSYCMCFIRFWVPEKYNYFSSTTNEKKGG